jgi:hypothetical protein
MKDDWRRRLVPARKAVVLIRISVGLMFIAQGFDEGRQDGLSLPYYRSRFFQLGLRTSICPLRVRISRQGCG